jgi:hypothetical protein
MRTWVLAEFPSPSALVAAATRVRDAGFTDLDTHSPFPLREGDEALRLNRSRVPLIALLGGLTGAAGAYAMQWWMNAVDYPINVGNRPPHSPPSFIPITFEVSVLIAGLSIFFGLIFLSRLPQPYHPVFELDTFRSASSHGFWLSVEVEGVEQRESLEKRLQELGATEVSAVQEGA